MSWDPPLNSRRCAYGGGGSTSSFEKARDLTPRGGLDRFCKLVRVRHARPRLPSRRHAPGAQPPGSTTDPEKFLAAETWL